MSSILTNNGAMVALQTLRSINSNMADTQSAISTGKDIATAKDNSAVWAISKVMASDVKGFEAITDSLALGESTVAVAQNGAEAVTDLLTEIKGKIVASQEENVDRNKIQADINALRDQIGSVVGAAQFNGLNLLGNTSRTKGEGSVNVLSSLDRSGSGVVASNITIEKNDLGTAKAAYTGSTALASVTAAQNIDAANTSRTITIAPTVTTGQAYSIGLAATDADNSTVVQADWVTGTTSADQSKILYVAREGDTAEDVAAGLVAAYNGYASKKGLDLDVLSLSATGSTITASTNTTFGTGDNIAVRLDGGATTAAGATNSASIGGALSALADFDVTTSNGAKAALAGIEGMITKSIDSAASFGSNAGRIETQATFVSKLTDSLKSGIGSLVDADMEATSARLQALQTQQQLAVQSLSIANQAPQTILSLFR